MLALSFYHEGGFGGMRDKFDLIVPPTVMWPFSDLTSII
jgi:hypothetical protein